MFLYQSQNQTDLLTKKKNNIYSEVKVKSNIALQLSQKLLLINVNHTFQPPLLSQNKIVYLPSHDQN